MALTGTDAPIVRPYSRYSSPEKIKNASVEISNPPPRNEKILRNFDFILPKFHFILPNFYFGPPWKNFVSSLTLPNFLPRRDV